jgi:hypothetical protein
MFTPINQTLKQILFCIILLTTGIQANCQIEKINDSKNENLIIVEFAQKNLPPNDYARFDWTNHQKVEYKDSINGLDSIIGWVVKPITKYDTTIIAIFIRAEGNIPVDIVENKITSIAPGTSQKSNYNLKADIKRASALPLELVQYSYIHKTKKVLILPKENKTIDGKDINEVKKTDPEKAFKMLPNIIIYRGGNPPKPRLYIKLDTFLPANISGGTRYIPVDEL